MRGKIDVVERRPPQVSVVKSVKEVSKLVGAVVTPAPKIVLQNFSKMLNYEHHYGAERRPSPPATQGAIRSFH